MSGRPKVFGQLLTEVVRKGRCVGCGSCESSCPVESIAMEGGVPKLVGLCIACGVCYGSCPRSVFDDAEIERQVFGRVRKEEETDTGVFRSHHAVRATDEETLKHCQDGGAVTAILTQFLNEGGECAVVTGLEEGKIWYPTPMVALTKGDVIKGSGTKYTSSPTLVGVDSAVREYNKKKIAVVGTPCQVRAMRRIETSVQSNVKISEALALKVGLFCMETFGYDGLMEFLRGEGVDVSKVTKFSISKGKFRAHSGGETVYEAKLSKVKALVRPCCEECEDFTAEFADVSVGNVGSPDGWSTVFVRTQKGEEAFNAALKNGLIEAKPIEEGKAGMDMVVRLARAKKKKEKAEG